MYHQTCLPNLAAVDSDHWLEAEMSSSWICPPVIPRGYRHISTNTQSITDTHAAPIMNVFKRVCVCEICVLSRAIWVFILFCRMWGVECKVVRSCPFPPVPFLQPCKASKAKQRHHCVGASLSKMRQEWPRSCLFSSFFKISTGATWETLSSFKALASAGHSLLPHLYCAGTKKQVTKTDAAS